MEPLRSSTTERQWAVAVTGMPWGGELEGEVDGLGAIREDGRIIEQDGRFHRPPA